MSYTATYRPNAKGEHPFNAYVQNEALDAQRTHLLFAPHILVDVSQVKQEQKNGNDFFLRLLGSSESQGFYRIENKFEQYASGNVVLELVSYDRPRIAPGWIFTSKAAWLLSWFPTGEVCCWPMQELREYVLSNPARHLSTTALNKRYLSWSALESISHLLQVLPGARVLNLNTEIGEAPLIAKKLVSGPAEQRRCSASEFISHLRKLPQESTPYVPTEQELVQYMQQLHPLNLKREHPRHRAMLSTLPQAWGLHDNNS